MSSILHFKPSLVLSTLTIFKWSKHSHLIRDSLLYVIWVWIRS